VRVAAISDIHGNLPALEAVLAEIDREGVDEIVVVGDTAHGPWPAEVVDLLVEREALCVRGNADREVIERSDRFGPLAPGTRWTYSFVQQSAGGARINTEDLKLDPDGKMRATVTMTIADADEARHEYGIELLTWEALPQADAVIVAVAHEPLLATPLKAYATKLKNSGCFIDVKSQFNFDELVLMGLKAWRL